MRTLPSVYVFIRSEGIVEQQENEGKKQSASETRIPREKYSRVFLIQENFFSPRFFSLFFPSWDSSFSLCALNFLERETKRLTRFQSLSLKRKTIKKKRYRRDSRRIKSFSNRSEQPLQHTKRLSKRIFMNDSYPRPVNTVHEWTQNWISKSLHRSFCSVTAWKYIRGL